MGGEIRWLDKMPFGSEKDNRLESFLAGIVLPNIGTTDLMHELFLTGVKPQASSLPVLGKFSTNFNTNCTCKVNTTEYLLWLACTQLLISYNSFVITVHMEVLQLSMDNVSFRARITVCCGAFLCTFLVLYGCSSDGNNYFSSNKRKARLAS